MLPSKVMPYLLRLAAPLTDSSIVQNVQSQETNLGENLRTASFLETVRVFLSKVEKFGLIAGTTNHTSTPEALIDVPKICVFNL